MIDRWYGVSCDDCGDSAEIMPLSSEAWAAAARDGWTRQYVRPLAENAGRRGMEHYCPDCTKHRHAAGGV